MMFVDGVKIYVKGGDGGDGMVAFRREKFVANGGPAGGDGGKGGSVVFEVEEGLRTLVDFRYKRHFKGNPGENGMSKGMHGHGAPDYVVPVPPGTIVKDADTGELIADLVTHGQRAVVAKGGRHGRGNRRFATPANPAPEISENGEPGEERNLELELKVLADVGLVGFPSVGKSTLLSVVTSARPKIADYHFTTLTPNLGMVDTPDHRSFAMADLPGLIEGASLGVGLGHQFLKHIERTRVIVHVIDMAGTEGRDPFDDFNKINDELSQYNFRLLERPQIIVANKMDMPGAEENLETFKKQIDSLYPVFPISALTKTGLNNLLLEIANKLETTEYFPMNNEPTEEQVVMYKHKADSPDFEITRGSDAVWVLSGSEIERLFAMTNFDREVSVTRFTRQLRSLGVDQALRDRGAKDGDLVRIIEFEFEFMD